MAADLRSGRCGSRQIEHVSDVQDAFLPSGQRQRQRLRCIGFERSLAARATPCRCSGCDMGSYVWHNYKPLGEKLEALIESVVQEYADKEVVVVAAAYSVHRFVDLRGASVCRDQFLRLTMAALCVSAKYWDEGAALACQNSRIAGRAGIALEDFNSMEIAFMRGLGWTLAMSELQFEEWAAKLEALGEEALKEQETRCDLERCNQSPLLSTDMAEQLSGANVSFATPCAVPEVTAEEVELRAGAVGTVMRVSSSAKDSKGDAITTRLVFPSFQPEDASSVEVLLRAGSESVSRTEHAAGGATILRCYSYGDLP